MENENIDPIIRMSLEYYDKYQQKINNFLHKVDKIEMKNTIDNETSNSIIFYDKNDKILLESRYEILSVYIPKSGIWKWAWALPSATRKNNFISRKILEYSFNLNSDNDYLLKSTLASSKIVINNKHQLDIHIALSAYLSKIPFIYRMFLEPLDTPFYNPDKIDKDNTNIISSYLFIIDYEKIID